MVQFVLGKRLAGSAPEFQTDGLGQVHVQVGMRTVFVMGIMVFMVNLKCTSVIDDQGRRACPLRFVIVAVMMQVIVLVGLSPGVILVRHFCGLNRSEHYGVVQNEQQGYGDLCVHGVGLVRVKVRRL